MIPIDYNLKDIIISAFRYALGRNSYITLSTCDYIKKHPEVIDERVKEVLLRNLEQLDFFYDNINDTDYKLFTNFRVWLENLEVKKNENGILFLVI